MRIGLGGGAASSMGSGSNTAELDFDSVQTRQCRDPAPRAEVIDGCRALGDANRSCRSMTSARAACPTRSPSSSTARIVAPLRARPRSAARERSVAGRDWCNESQERYVLGIAPESLRPSISCAGASAARMRWSARCRTTGRLVLAAPTARSGRHADGTCCSQAAEMHRDARRRARALPELDASGFALAEVAPRVLRLPAVPRSRS
jgi:phosphoribosylformylglycinamidine synthase